MPGQPPTVVRLSIVLTLFASNKELSATVAHGVCVATVGTVYSASPSKRHTRNDTTADKDANNARVILT